MRCVLLTFVHCVLQLVDAAAAGDVETAKTSIAALKFPAASINKPVRLFATPGEPEHNANALIRAIAPNDGLSLRWGATHMRTPADQTAIIRELVNAKADLDYQHLVPQNRSQGIHNPFAMAMAEMRMESQRYQLPKQEYRTPLMLAVENGDHEVVRLLLELKADPSVDVNGQPAFEGRTPLTALHYELVKENALDPKLREGVTIVRTHFTVCCRSCALMSRSHVLAAENAGHAVVDRSHA